MSWFKVPGLVLNPVKVHLMVSLVNVGFRGDFFEDFLYWLHPFPVIPLQTLRPSNLVGGAYPETTCVLCRLWSEYTEPFLWTWYFCRRGILVLALSAHYPSYTEKEETGTMSYLSVVKEIFTILSNLLFY